jgi:hypothetical protein
MQNQGTWYLYESLKKACAENTKKLRMMESTSAVAFRGGHKITQEEIDRLPDELWNKLSQAMIDDDDKVMDEIASTIKASRPAESKVVEASEKAKPDVPQTQKPGESKELEASDVGMEDRSKDANGKKVKKDKDVKDNETGTKEMAKVDDKLTVNPAPVKAKESKVNETTTWRELGWDDDLSPNLIGWLLLDELSEVIGEIIETDEKGLTIDDGDGEKERLGYIGDLAREGYQLKDMDGRIHPMRKGKLADESKKPINEAIKYAVIKTEKYGGMRELKRFDDKQTADIYAENARGRIKLGPDDMISVEEVKVSDESRINKNKKLIKESLYL